jgi:succinate dehydrogenase/fumarate reductase flavoprotein subunit
MSPQAREVDLLVLGAGAAGMTAAVTAAAMGLDVLLVEKTELVGGTTSRSAGSVWVPNTRHSTPGQDSFDNALRFLRGTVGNRLRESMARSFLSAAPAMVDFLEDNTSVHFRAYARHPDYLATVDGATLSGRVLEPVPFDASVLGDDFERLRPPLPEFTLLSGMMVDRTDIGHLLNATKSLASFAHCARLFARYGADRLRFRRGARLVMGNALAGRLYYSLLQRRVPILTSTQVGSLVEGDGCIAGAVLQSPEGAVTVHSRRGVVLATGGFSRHPELRARLLPDLLSPHSPVVDSATGDGAVLGQTAGGHLGSNHASYGFWSPVSVRTRSDGSTAVFPHFVLDRGKPGLIAVNAQGRRFVSEAIDYHLFVEAMFASRAVPCHFICDDMFMTKYGLGMARPRRINLRQAIADRYVTQAATLADLAQALRLPAAGLAETVARHNGFAATGVDEEFRKGSDAYQRNLGDPTHGPNPCIGVIATPPFYAVQIHAGDIGASCGLVTNEFAQVLRPDGSCVDGLYASGNDMDSMMAGVYPGPGITIGPAMTFGFVAARHAAGRVAPAAP